MTVYLKPTCKGSYVLGTACGNCERCDEEQARINAQQSKTSVIENPMTVVQEQAEDEALWFFAERITESILQKALRRLHAAVEGEEYYGQ